MPPTTSNLLAQPVEQLAGVGPQSAQKLQRLGLYKVQDLLWHLPLRYEDHTRVYPINSLQTDMQALVCGKVEFADIAPGRKPSLICRISDATGFIQVRFFHFTPRQLQQLRSASYISCFGEVRYGFTGLELVHPEYQLVPSPAHCRLADCLTPVYPVTEGLHQTVMRKAIQQTLQYCQTQPQALTECLPPELLQRLELPDLLNAINTLHSPRDNSIAIAPAIKRLAFEELLTHHLSLRQLKSAQRLIKAPPLAANPALLKQFLDTLPFQLTQAQQRVSQEVTHDCARATPMLRLVQGDVGSGKTVVAAQAALLAVSNHYQVAIMAPTELLAEQHFRNFQVWFSSLNIPVTFLSGQIKGQARQTVLQQIAAGTAAIVIGTHALFQEQVNFKQLGLIIIDEQHRFGVHQRLALRNKGDQAGLRPHQLIMTATPIPRTLAMLNYADLDVSIIDELPPGRKAIVTSVIPSDRREAIIARIQQWVAQRRQAYWVCTLIEESDALACEAAEKTASLLTTALPSVRVGLVHGRMKAAEKESIMQAFKQHHLDLLVATTVIEVGVDVPNAALMIIENPERLGLSQLHQLRGRVGRGSLDSYCVLLFQAPLSAVAKERLSILRDTQDGFLIAEKDLALRGPGEIMGTRQTGQLSLKIADLARDSDLLENIQSAADYLLEHTPAVIPTLTERWLQRSSHYAEV